jgi:gliding motility-associated-like protein
MYYFWVVLILYLGFVQEYNQILHVAPEICDNGIDDDGDGLIDLNDTTDCFCLGISDSLYVPASLIPNPSFEDTICCPNGLAQLVCAQNWIQASRATSDYYHTCGFTSDPARGEAPLPLPSGDAYVGFLDTYWNGAAWKEYVGACLKEPMEAGKDYLLQFYLGFGSQGLLFGPNRTFKVMLYGNADCDEIPFGTNFTFCPSVIPGWLELSSVTLRGTNEWVRGTMRFSPNWDINSVVIGSSCDAPRGDNYFFLDELILNEKLNFDNSTFEIEGPECDTLVRLNTIAVPGISYQWYRNGVALVGDTLPEYFIKDYLPGSYVLMAISGGDCQLSLPFEYYPQKFETIIDTTICVGDSVWIGGQNYYSSQQTEISLKSQNGCDSIIQLNIVVLDSTASSVDTQICNGQIIKVGQMAFDRAGYFRIVMTNSAGCDSFINLRIKVVDTLINSIDTNLCIGDEFFNRGIRYSEDTIIEYLDKTSVGCDSLTLINVRFRRTHQHEVDTGVCVGNGIILHGQQISQAGDYPFHFANQFGCDSSVIYHVKLNDTFRTVIDTYLCAGSSIVIGRDTFITTGEYRIEFSSQNNCDSQVVYRIREINNQLINLDTAFCEGHYIVIEDSIISSPGVYEFVFSNTNGCDSMRRYHVVKRDTSIYNIDTTICWMDTLFWSGRSFYKTGQYEISFQGAENCDSLLQLDLNVISPFYVDVADTLNLSCNRDSNGYIEILTSGNTHGLTIAWEDGSTSFQRYNLSRGDYRYTIRTPEGCFVERVLLVSEPDEITFDLASLDLLCDQDSSGIIQVKNIHGGVPPYQVFINGDKRNLENSGLSSGRYEIQIFDGNNCEVDTTVLLHQPNKGILTLESINTDLIVGDSVELLPVLFNIDSIVSIDWYSDNGHCLSCFSWIVKPPLGQNTYYVTVLDNNGCSYSASIILSVTQTYFIPNVFTPNGDLLNDFFNAYTDRSIEMIRVMRIFDRWGELIFEANDISPGYNSNAWDGMFNGEPLNPGVYVYYIELKDCLGNSFIESGDVTLLR